MAPTSRDNPERLDSKNKERNNEVKKKNQKPAGQRVNSAKVRTQWTHNPCQGCTDAYSVHMLQKAGEVLKASLLV